MRQPWSSQRKNTKKRDMISEKKEYKEFQILTFFR